MKSSEPITYKSHIIQYVEQIAGLGFFSLQTDDDGSGIVKIGLFPDDIATVVSGLLEGYHFLKSGSANSSFLNEIDKHLTEVDGKIVVDKEWLSTTIETIFDYLTQLDEINFKHGGPFTWRSITFVDGKPYITNLEQSMFMYEEENTKRLYLFHPWYPLYIYRSNDYKIRGKYVSYQLPKDFTMSDFNHYIFTGVLYPRSLDKYIFVSSLLGIDKVKNILIDLDITRKMFTEYNLNVLKNRKFSDIFSMLYNIELLYNV